MAKFLTTTRSRTSPFALRVCWFMSPRERRHHSSRVTTRARTTKTGALGQSDHAWPTAFDKIYASQPRVTVH
eukprot:scaffold15108_cov180-Amphora_coffeaeformis.AAC.16